MKSFKKFLCIMLVGALLICSVACGNTGRIMESEDGYNSSIWDETDLTVFLEFENDYTEEYVEDENTESTYKVLDSMDSEILQEVVGEVNSFFISNYEIYLEDKLSKIKDVKYIELKSEGADDGIIDGGFIEDDTIYIGEYVASEKKDVKKSYLLHLLLHYIGLEENEDGRGDLVIEGIIEAIANSIAIENHWEYSFIGYFQQEYFVAEQILVVDNDLIEKLLKDEEFSFVNHFESVMSNVPIYDVNSEEINCDIMDILFGTLFELSFDDELAEEDEFIMYEQMQLIIIAYCREFSPTQEKIDAIRSFYYISNFEEIIYESNEVFDSAPEAIAVRA